MAINSSLATMSTVSATVILSVKDEIIVNLHVCICKNKICIWSNPGVNLPICKFTPVCICVRMCHLLTSSKIYTPEYIYTMYFWRMQIGLQLTFKNYEGGSESSVIGVISVNRHDRLLYYTLIERATFLLYNDAKRMPERNKYFEIDALKDTWGKTNGTFS